MSQIHVEANYTQESLQLYHELYFFMLKRKQLRISIYLISGVVCSFYEIYSESNETVCG